MPTCQVYLPLKNLTLSNRSIISIMPTLKLSSLLFIKRSMEDNTLHSAAHSSHNSRRAKNGKSHGRDNFSPRPRRILPGVESNSAPSSIFTHCRAAQNCTGSPHVSGNDITFCIVHRSIAPSSDESHKRALIRFFRVITAPNAARTGHLEFFDVTPVPPSQSCVVICLRPSWKTGKKSWVNVGSPDAHTCTHTQASSLPDGSPSVQTRLAALY